MSSRKHAIPALDELREGLLAAAQRDVGERRPARRRRRRGLALVLVVVLGGGAAAGAADLISSGSPVPDNRHVLGKYKPSTELQLTVTAHDAVAPWGVGVYETKDGQSCAVVGRVRGAQLGELAGGQFHPYKPDVSGACGPRKGLKSGMIVGERVVRDGRTVLYGRAVTKHVTVVVDGQSRVADTGAGGAWLLVFDGDVTPSSVTAG